MLLQKYPSPILFPDKNKLKAGWELPSQWVVYIIFILNHFHTYTSKCLEFWTWELIWNPNLSDLWTLGVVTKKQPLIS